MSAPRIVLDASVVLATFDRRHLLPLDPFKGVRLLTPGDVLRDLR